MEVQFKFKLGQLVYDEYYGLGWIDSREHLGRYQEYCVKFVEPSKDPDDEGTDFGWFSEEWIEDKVDEPCLKLNLPVRKDIR